MNALTILLMLAVGKKKGRPLPSAPISGGLARRYRGHDFGQRGEDADKAAPRVTLHDFAFLVADNALRNLIAADLIQRPPAVGPIRMARAEVQDMILIHGCSPRCQKSGASRFPRLANALYQIGFRHFRAHQWVSGKVALKTLTNKFYLTRFLGFSARPA